MSNSCLICLTVDAKVESPSGIAEFYVHAQKINSKTFSL